MRNNAFIFDDFRVYESFFTRMFALGTQFKSEINKENNKKTWLI